jgi:hypothetical protein
MTITLQILHGLTLELFTVIVKTLKPTNKPAIFFICHAEIYLMFKTIHSLLKEYI